MSSMILYVVLIVNQWMLMQSKKLKNNVTEQNHKDTFNMLSSKTNFIHNENYTDKYIQSYFPNKPNAGVYITCFVAFRNNHPSITSFLNHWMYQTYQWTTQDQVSFTFSLFYQKLAGNLISLPDNGIEGSNPHNRTMLYNKHNHHV